LLTPLAFHLARAWPSARFPGMLVRRPPSSSTFELASSRQPNSIAPRRLLKHERRRERRKRGRTCPDRIANPAAPIATECVLSKIPGKKLLRVQQKKDVRERIFGNCQKEFSCGMPSHYTICPCSKKCAAARTSTKTVLLPAPALTPASDTFYKLQSHP
jgi:hypothetical protein